MKILVNQCPACGKLSFNRMGLSTWICETDSCDVWAFVKRKQKSPIERLKSKRKGRGKK